MSDSSQVGLKEAHQDEKIGSAAELDIDDDKKRNDQTDVAPRRVEPNVLVNGTNKEKGNIQRVQLLKLDAYARHKKFINDYVLYYNGSALLQRDTSHDRTDLDIIRENHRFLWSDDDGTDTWGKRIAKQYYDKLFKEYAIADLSRYRENKIALRWRVEREVVEGKGQFSCGNKSCSEEQGLRSWEVNFAYMEDAEKKNALVKLRMCPECSYRLNYYHQKKEVNAKRKSKHSSKKKGDMPPKKTMKTGEFSKSDSSESQSNEQATPDGSVADAKADETESVLWKGPVQVDDKSKEDEFDDYFVGKYKDILRNLDIDHTSGACSGEKVRAMSLNDMDEDAGAQLNLCQNLYFKSLDAAPLQKLDCLRGLMQQVVFAKEMNNLSSRTMGMLITDYGNQYSTIMDSDDPSTGVKNYADEALSLASLKNSEIDKWQSGLQLDTIGSLSGIKPTLDKSSIIKDQNADNAAFLKQLRLNWITKNEPAYELPLCGDEDKKLNVASSLKMPQTSNPKANFRAQRYERETELLPEKSLTSYQPIKPTLFAQSKHFSTVQARGKGNSNLTGVKRKQEDMTESNERKFKDGPGAFRTAKDQLALDVKSNKAAPNNFSYKAYGSSKKSLGSRRGGVNGQFVPPILNKDEEEDEDQRPAEDMQDERLKNIEAKMVELIKNEIMDHGPPVKWDDIAGLEFVKKTIKEIVVFPMLRPDIFTGLRGPPKGLLLFGPPGTGKTLIGKCIASNSRSTFFSISASSLTSKWVGEGEKMVRALFAVARCRQPAVIFIDEIDSLLTQRSDTEHESSRRMKTEFLVQLDGAATDAEDKLLVVGATNRPQELDEAARRRLVKRLYVPLPEHHARKQIIVNLLNDQRHNLTNEDIEEIGLKAEGYSGADMANLCKEAALGPVRCLSFADIEQISVDAVRPITKGDFIDALHQIKPSVSSSDLRVYLDWNQKFGSTNRQ